VVAFPKKIYSLLVKQLVEPIVTCNACIWGHYEIKNVLNIQTNALRFLLGVGKTCPKVIWGDRIGTFYIRFSILKKISKP
jgi:hypothetical protein